MMASQSAQSTAWNTTGQLGQKLRCCGIKALLDAEPVRDFRYCWLWRSSCFAAAACLQFAQILILGISSHKHARPQQQQCDGIGAHFWAGPAPRPWWHDPNWSHAPWPPLPACHPGADLSLPVFLMLAVGTGTAEDIKDSPLGRTCSSPLMAQPFLVTRSVAATAGLVSDFVQSVLIRRPLT